MTNFHTLYIVKIHFWSLKTTFIPIILFSKKTKFPFHDPISLQNKQSKLNYFQPLSVAECYRFLCYPKFDMCNSVCHGTKPWVGCLLPSYVFWELCTVLGQWWTQLLVNQWLPQTIRLLKCRKFESWFKRQIIKGTCFSFLHTFIMMVTEAWEMQNQQHW